MLPIRPGLSRQLSAASMQVPMLSAPLKQTTEIDWVQPLKDHIRSAYSDDPERYNEECATLNRLRQDMRGAGKDSAAGRDLLYRYYGQLELLDLRFPVDENHIKISFTWYDAFTLKPTSQYSLAFEKASIIFNISAVLSCHAADQNRHEGTGLKTAYHWFQASAGLFTYINENFLHAPSTDLSRETVKTLINIMLAQGQEVFIEKHVMDKKKPGLLAKLAAQAAYLYAQAVEGVQELVNKGVFERVWLLVVQIKQHHIASVAQYYQAVADYEANSYGQSICRLYAAQNASKEASRLANGFPSTVSATSNLGNESGTVLADMTKKQASAIHELLAEYNRDNDMIYHQPVPSENTLTSIPKLPAAKPIPVSELYQGQNIQSIIGPDIFQRIVPMAVTESASLYDEEKAKLLRAEVERVQTADDELATSLDYLKLPGSLKILKGGHDQDSGGVDDEFRRWCADLSGHDSFKPVFETLREDKQSMLTQLDKSSKQLDLEESVCEKMRSKYGAEWTQQPSSRLTSTLRADIRSHRSAVEEASTSDAQLYSTFRQFESDFDEMRSAGETDEADVLYQRAMIKVGGGRKSGTMPGTEEGNLLDDDFADEHRPSVASQIERVEELLHKLQLVKRERQQVLKDLKEKVHNDDISNVLILNKKAITDQDDQLFKAELEKFRPHQSRISQANHKQTTVMKDLTQAYNKLLNEAEIRTVQNKYEAFLRKRNAVLGKYRKVFQAFNDLQAGLSRAKQFYDEWKNTVDSLQKNVETFVENRRTEGGQLLNAIEAAKGSGAEREQARMKELMERMSLSPSTQPSASPQLGRNGDQRSSVQHRPTPLPAATMAATQLSNYNPASPPITPRYAPNGMTSPGFPTYGSTIPQNGGISREPYNPTNFAPMASPGPSQQYHSQSYNQNYGGYSSPPAPAHYTQQATQPGQFGSQSLPQGWQPPPPPPGPPPTQDYSAIQNRPYPAGPGGYAHDPRRSGAQPPPPPPPAPPSSSNDPWAGLNSWK